MEMKRVILHRTVNSKHAIEATPTMVNIKGETIEYIFQTSYGALKVRNLIGVNYGSSVELSKRWNMCCKQNQNYECKRCYIDHKSLTHQILGLISLFYAQLNLLVNKSTGRIGMTWFRCFCNRFSSQLQYFWTYRHLCWPCH